LAHLAGRVGPGQMEYLSDRWGRRLNIAALQSEILVDHAGSIAGFLVHSLHALSVPN